MQRPLRTRLSPALALALSLLCLTGAARAEYPERAIRMVLPFASGQGTDIASRVVMTEVSKRLGQPIVIDNRPGASGMIAIQQVQKAAPDGYTVLGLSSSFLGNGALLKAPLPYDLQRDFIPVVRVVDSSVVLVTQADRPVKNLADVLGEARRNPQGVTVGSGGVATTMHLAVELLRNRTNANIVHVPYKGDPPALNDVIGGTLPYTVSGLAAALPHMRSGKLKALAVSAASRIEAIPDVPTIAESGYPGFELIGWLAFLVPTGTPQPVVDKLYGAIRAGAEEREAREKMANLGMFLSRNQKPAEFRAYMAETQQKLEEAIRLANIKPE